MVIILSPVSMLSLMRIGMPCRGPRGPFVFAFAIELGGNGAGVGIQVEHRAELGTIPIDTVDPREVKPTRRSDVHLRCCSPAARSARLTSSNSKSEGVDETGLRERIDRPSGGNRAGDSGGQKRATFHGQYGSTHGRARKNQPAIFMSWRNARSASVNWISPLDKRGSGTKSGNCGRLSG